MGLYEDIAEAADALTNPSHHAEPRYEWDANRNKKPIKPHITVVPGLIQQLREALEPSSGGDDTGVHTVPESRPPGDFNAVNLLASITYGVLRRLTDPPARDGKPFGGLGQQPRSTPEENINAIVGALNRADHDTLRAIAAELRSWRWQAEVITKWREPAIQLVAPCPATNIDAEGSACGARGTLLAQPDAKAARCTGCGTTWDEDAGTMRMLIRHVQDYTAQSRAEATAKRETVRAVKVEQRQADEAAREKRRTAA